MLSTWLRSLWERLNLEEVRRPRDRKRIARQRFASRFERLEDRTLLTCMAAMPCRDSAIDFSLTPIALDVSNGAPVVSIAEPSYTIQEGQSLTLAATATDADMHDLSYRWDINGDGTFGDAIGANPTLTWEQLQALGISDGPAMFQLAVAVDDGQGNTTISSTVPLVVNDLEPTLTISGNASVRLGNPYELNLTSSDPGADSMTAWIIDWGDGSAPQVVSGNPASVTYHYVAGVNTYTISAMATNEDGTFVASNTLAVNVLQAKPTFSELSAPTIVVGTASVTIAGKLNANAGMVTIPAGQIVQIRLYGAAQDVAIDAGGNFSATFATNSLKPDRAYAIIFRYAGDTSFGAAAGSSTLTVQDYPAPKNATYWRTNPTAWSVNSLVLGGYRYDKAELLAILRASPRGDARIVLAKELIAAKLNVANGSNPALTASVVREGDRLLRGRGKIAPGSTQVALASSAGKLMMKRAIQLAIYPLVPGLR